MPSRDIETRFIHALHLHRRKKHRVHQDLVKAHELYQISTLSVLMEGLYDGHTTYAKLAEHGDFGLGTFNSLDGEMIAFDGLFFQILADGTARLVDPSMKTPFAVVIFFEPDIQLDLPNRMLWQEFETLLKQVAPSHLVFYAIRLEGTFEYVKLRNVCKQQEPYAPLGDLVRDFPVLELRHVRGTMVGFRCPDYSQGINVPGYHMHFINEDREVGGHVLTCTANGVKLQIDHTFNLRMEIPEGFVISEKTAPRSP